MAVWAVEQHFANPCLGLMMNFLRARARRDDPLASAELNRDGFYTKVLVIFRLSSGRVGANGNPHSCGPLDQETLRGVVLDHDDGAEALVDRLELREDVRGLPAPRLNLAQTPTVSVVNADREDGRQVRSLLLAH